MKTVLPSIVWERHQTYLVCIVVGALYLKHSLRTRLGSNLPCLTTWVNWPGAETWVMYTYTTEGYRYQPIINTTAKIILHDSYTMVRARHWCLPHCPGQVEFVNYSCGASENCILLAPLGKYVLYIFQVYFWECVQALWSAIQAFHRKYAFTCQNHVLLGFKWNIIKLFYTIF